jgi:UDP-glucose 4-epimerase
VKASRKIKKALVTGGAGFIGSHIAHGLLAKGIDTVVLDDLSAGSENNIPKNARFIHADIRDSEKLREAISGCDTIFHLAARIDLQKSILDPDDCLSVNVAGTEEVIREACGVPGSKIIFASSAAVYPLNPQAPLREGDAGPGDSPYAFSKRASEQSLDTFARIAGHSAISLRCFNIYGPGQRVDGGYAAVIPKFIALAKAGKSITINGSGKQTRDFIHVSDVVACYILAAQSEASDVFNVGTGEATSVLRLAELIRGFEGKSPLEFRPANQGDASASLADLSHLRAHLGFQHQVSLEKGLRELYAL